MENIITVTPNSKGQITIPIGIREKYGIAVGTPLLLTDREGAIELKRITRIETDDVWDNERRTKLLALLKQLKGSWADDTKFEERAKKQRQLELRASRRNRRAW